MANPTPAPAAPFDITNDNLVMDFLGSINYYSTPDGIWPVGGPTNVTLILNCLYRVRGKSENDYLEVTTLPIHIWAADLVASGIVPKVFDTVQIADGSYWIIERVDYDSWLTRYRLSTKRAIL
jgi:hypothetical protein